MNEITSQDSPDCLNCGARLQGSWCHVCGQPVKGMVRDFPLIMGDLVDTLFEYDNRIWRTLLQIYFRPGRVTNDFFVGRRVRYVLPFRLFFTLSLITFLMLQLVAVPQTGTALEFAESETRFSEYQTVADVNIARDRAITNLQQELARVEQGLEQNRTVSGINLTTNIINAAANRRIAQLEGGSDTVDSASAESAAETTPALVFDGITIWDREQSPVNLPWLPATTNRALTRWLDQWITQAENNLERAGEDPGSLLEAMYSFLPLALFLMMPIFALLLKVFYLMKRRMYMEHLVVALHSHSFLFMAIVVSVALGMFSAWAESVPVLGAVLSFLFYVSMFWFPVYLLLMQKRVYAQGWPMTLIKFSGLAFLYTIMIVVVLALGAIISLVNL